MKKRKSGAGLMYEPLVSIRNLEDFRSKEDRKLMGDRRDGKLYRYTPEIKLHVNVALATARPLLVLGPSGCGKSSLAFNVARVMRRRYYEFVVTSRSQARDLFYRYDAVRRLGDAHLAKRADAAGDDTESVRLTQYPYIEPGPLWWMFNRQSAAQRGYDGAAEITGAKDPAMWSPPGKPDAPAVLLIDEIDKAEPDFPNNLLVPLGSHQFILEEVAQVISLRAAASDQTEPDVPLVVITSNRERELPDAFIRRCVVLEIQGPTVDELVEIGAAVTGERRDGFFRSVAEKIKELRGQQDISIAEFLDAVYAVEKLNAQDPLLGDIVRSTSWRQREG